MSVTNELRLINARAPLGKFKGREALSIAFEVMSNFKVFGRADLWLYKARAYQDEGETKL